MFQSKRFAILLTTLLVLAAIQAFRWKNYTPVSLSASAPPVVATSSASSDTAVNFSPQMPVAVDDETKKSPERDASQDKMLAAPFNPGEVGMEEVIAEGLTPYLLDADALYYNRSEYRIVPSGISGVPGDPNTP